MLLQDLTLFLLLKITHSLWRRAPFLSYQISNPIC